MTIAILAPQTYLIHATGDRSGYSECSRKSTISFEDDVRDMLIKEITENARTFLAATLGAV